MSAVSRTIGRMKITARVFDPFRWMRDHIFASVWILLAPLATVGLALDTRADWVAVVLFGLAGLSWSGVLMAAAIRHAAVPIAGTVAALSGGTLALILGDPSSRSTRQAADEIAILLLAMVAAGAAAFFGQIKNQADQRRSERNLSEQLAALAELHAVQLAELRADLARVLDERQRRRPWWFRAD